MKKIMVSIPLHHVYRPRWALKSNRQNCESLYVMIWDTHLMISKADSRHAVDLCSLRQISRS